jgi:hypothetical protein
MKKMSCVSLHSTGAQPCKVTEEKSIVMWCETCGGESIDWKMHWSHTHRAWHPYCYWQVKVASMQAILFCPLGFLLMQALPKNDYYIYFLTTTAGSWWSQWIVMAACPCYIVINVMKVWHFCEWLSLIRLWLHSCDVVTSLSVCYCGDQYYVYSSTSSPLWWKNDVHLSVISALVLWRMHLLTPSLSNCVASVTAGMAE